jgi:hypothetical protein
MPKHEKDATTVNTKTASTGARINEIDVRPTKTAAEILSRPPKFPELRKP